MNARRKRHLKSSLTIAPYLLVLSLSATYVLVDSKNIFETDEKISSIKDDITENDIKDEIISSIDKNPDLNIHIEEPIEDIPEEVEEIESQYISTELLESGYNFETIDFDSLQKINSDAEGWMVFSDTKIDLPVVSAPDNEFYLHHDIEGNKSSSGTLFTDYRNEKLTSENPDDITFIYGHHMKGGRMLASICNYKNQEYADNHLFGVMYTPDGYAYKLSVVASMVVDGKDETEVFKNNFQSDEEFLKYMDLIRDESLIKTEEEIKPGDKILALVTCTYEKENARCIVYFKLEKQYTKIEQLEETKDNKLIR